MLMKIFGVILIVSSCGSVGFQMARDYRREEKALEQLGSILEFMECELRYRLTPLPTLCRQIAKKFPATPGCVFLELTTEMESQASPDMAQCMESALRSARTVPPITKKLLELLGRTIGRFDLEGQLKAIESVQEDCIRSIKRLGNNRDSRLRSYQTLGLCAGAALAILLV